MTLAAALLALSSPSWASSDFLKNMHKAESRKETEEKIEYYSRAIRAWEPAEGNALLANCHFRRGEARYQRYDFSGAAPDLSKAIDLDPGIARAYFLRGRISLRSNHLAEALRDLLDYTASRREDSAGFLALGEIYLKSAEFGSALRAFKRAEQLDPSDFQAPLGSARVWMAQKEWDRALERLDAADELAKHRSPEALTERAVCRVAQGDSAKALEDYGLALPLYDRRLQDLDRSKASPGEIAESQERAARAYYGRGRLHEFLLRMPQAAADYQEACRLGHQEACLKARALGARPAASALRKPSAPHAEPEVEKKAEKPPKKSRKVESDAGDRIYAP